MPPNKPNKLVIPSIVLLTLLKRSNHARHDLKLDTNLNLKLLTIISPPPCNSNSPVDFLYVVHTAPSHFELRNTLRNSWAHSNKQSGNAKQVFFTGRSNRALEKSIMIESQGFADIFMYDMANAYRNMTIKVRFRHKSQ